MMRHKPGPNMEPMYSDGRYSDNFFTSDEYGPVRTPHKDYHPRDN